MAMQGRRVGSDRFILLSLNGLAIRRKMRLGDEQKGLDVAQNFLCADIDAQGLRKSPQKQTRFLRKNLVCFCYATLRVHVIAI